MEALEFEGLRVGARVEEPVECFGVGVGGVDAGRVVGVEFDDVDAFEHGLDGDHADGCCEVSESSGEGGRGGVGGDVDLDEAEVTASDWMIGSPAIETVTKRFGVSTTAAQPALAELAGAMIAWAVSTPSQRPVKVPRSPSSRTRATAARWVS